MSTKYTSAQTQQLLQKHPGVVPTVIQPDALFFMRIGKAGDSWQERKFAPPGSWTLGKLALSIRGRVGVSSKYAMFMFVHDRDNFILPSVSTTLSDLYEHYKDTDTGILFITVATEHTFGKGLDC